MTKEQKARAYDEALERAKKVKHDVENIGCSMSPDMLELIFPELAVRDDEWMINELQGFLSSYGSDYFGTGEWQKFDDWLEKQKEQKPVEIHIDNPNIQKTDPNVVIETRTGGTGELDGKALLYTADKSYQIGFRDGVASVKPAEWNEQGENGFGSTGK